MRRNTVDVVMRNGNVESW